MQVGESSRFSSQLHMCFTYVKLESKLDKNNRGCTTLTYVTKYVLVTIYTVQQLCRNSVTTYVAS